MGQNLDNSNVMKIALIEDNDCDVYFLRQSLLKNHQHDVYKSMCDFIASKKKYDIVLTDLSLSDSWGYATVKTIRKNSNAKIFVITGKTGENRATGKTYHGLIEEGALDVFEKEHLQEPHYLAHMKSIIFGGV